MKIKSYGNVYLTYKILGHILKLKGLSKTIIKEIVDGYIKRGRTRAKYMTQTTKE